MKRILDADGATVTIFHYDDATDTTTIQRRQDCESIVEWNKKMQTLNDGYSPSREFRRVASIPLTEFERWLAADGLTFQDYYQQMTSKERAKYRAKKLLEHSAFRTSPGPI